MLSNEFPVSQMFEDDYQLEMSFTLYNKLINQVLNGNGIAGITETVASFVHSTILVFDNYLHFLSYKSPYEQNELDLVRIKVRKHLENIFLYDKYHDQYVSLNHNNKPLPYEFELADKYYSSMIFPIIANNSILGYVVALKDGTHTIEQALVVFMKHAASVFALEIIQQKEISNFEQQFRWDFVEALFTKLYANEESIVEWGLRLGHNIKKPHRIIAMGVLSSSKNASVEELFMLRKEILKFSLSHFRKAYPSIFGADIKERLILFLPEATDNKKLIRDLLAKLKDNIEHHFPKTNVTFGVSDIVHRVGDYLDYYKQAKKAHMILNTYSKKDWVLFFDDLGSLNIILNLENKQELLDYVNKKLGPLLKYDAEHGSELVSSLENYLVNDSLRKTSQCSSISLSGLKYRLAKIKELGYNLQSPQERYDLHLALQILRITR